MKKIIFFAVLTFNLLTFSSAAFAWGEVGQVMQTQTLQVVQMFSVQIAVPQDQHPHTGGLLGAIAGGAIGHAVSNGHAGGTLLGALAGATVGAEIQARHEVDSVQGVQYILEYPNHVRVSIIQPGFNPAIQVGGWVNLVYENGGAVLLPA